MPGGTSEARSIRVNQPLETGGGSVFLLGNGYAPRITVRDAEGTVLYSDTTPFLPQDNNYTSVGAVKVPGAAPQQLGFAGFFLPTGVIDDSGPHSVFPDALDPQLALTAFEGELFPSGRPQSVYSLDTEAMTAIPAADGADQLRILLRPGRRSSSRAVGAPSRSTASSGSPGSRSAPTPARPSPSSAPSSPSPASWHHSSCAVDGSSSGLVPRRSRVVLWSPSEASPRTTTRGCPTRSTAS